MYEFQSFCKEGILSKTGRFTFYRRLIDTSIDWRKSKKDGLEIEFSSELTFNIIENLKIEVSDF